VTQTGVTELINLYHTAKGDNPLSRYDRMALAVRWFVAAHPDKNAGLVYKELDRALQEGNDA